MDSERLLIEDLGRVGYRAAYEAQVARVDEVIAARGKGRPVVGTMLLVEHEPVITLTKRPGVQAHLVATGEQLREAGVVVEETDRGGDITYHGPGQLVAYPILDLNHLNLRLHEYMRLLEGVVIEACATWGVEGHRDEGATGVWVRGEEGQSAKVCAMGVRVRRWVSMHGLAINVSTDLNHFDLIVACGLAGRSVTSLKALLGEAAPGMDEVKSVLGSVMRARVEALSGRRAGRG